MHAPLLLQLRRHWEIEHDSPPHSGAHTHVPLTRSQRPWAHAGSQVRGSEQLGGEPTYPAAQRSHALPLKLAAHAQVARPPAAASTQRPRGVQSTWSPAQPQSTSFRQPRRTRSVSRSRW